jgi:hypothetical protein
MTNTNPRNRVATLKGDAAGPNAPCHGFTGGVTSHNRHVVQNPRVVIIYWDSSFATNPEAISSLNQLVSDLLIGSFMEGLAQYEVNLGSVVGSVVIDNARYPIPAKINSDGFTSQLTKWLDDGAVVPKPSSNERNLVYLIVPPIATTVTDGTGACGYHGSGQYHTSGDDNLIWAAVFAYPSSSSSANNVAFCVSHELAEALSNPDQQGFFSDNVSGQSCEIADICESSGPGCCTTFPYLGWSVESYWSQSERTCHAPSGRLWHTIQMADGSWPFAFGDVEAQMKPDLGNVFRAACAADQLFNLHVCAIDAKGVLWHTIRKVDGSWQPSFGDVKAATKTKNLRATPRVACATNQVGDLHVCVIDDHGGLWHTIRMADGSWPFAFGDVQAETRKVGPNPGIGPTPFVACATNTAGDLHVCAIDVNGGLWHTIRMADGSWPFAFGDVLAVTKAATPAICETLLQKNLELQREVEHADPDEKKKLIAQIMAIERQREQNNCFSPDLVMYVACAVSPDSVLHVCAIDETADLWFANRSANGAWPVPFQVVQAKTRLVGPNVGIGLTPFVACATNLSGDLHVCAIA